MSDKASKILGIVISFGFVAFNTYMIATGAGLINWVMLIIFILLATFDTFALVEDNQQFRG